MPNDFFKFKQFIIRQNACSMKVCTDSCILGAFAAEQIALKKLTPENILDIGGGTGLLSLMLAQKTNAQIDAVEIQKNCFVQMSENFSASPWNHSVNAIQSDILQWNPGKKYDLIISNPPFFENDLKGSDYGKSIAMHDSGLRLNELLQCIHSNIAEDGRFIVMIAANRREYFEQELSENHASITSMLELKHRAGRATFRIIYSGNFASPANNYQTRELAIEDDKGYTNDFKNLLKDYYLNL